MEPTVSFNADEIRNKKVDVLHAVRPIPHGKVHQCAVRGQGVPFYLRTGKRLPRQSSGAAIQFRTVPHRSFPPESNRDWHPSRLVLSIQPEEGIVMGFQAKYPVPKMLLRPAEMRFSY